MTKELRWLIAVTPATPRKHFSTGLTYAFSKQSKLNFAYSPTFKKTMDNTPLPNTSTPLQIGRSQDKASINFRYSV